MKFFAIILIALVMTGISGTRKAIGQIAEKKKVESIRINIPPVIDGILDDLAWNHPSPASGFIKLQPYNGEAASLGSEVKFVYDDEALYVGAMLYDPNPDSIFTELSERDDRGMADYFGIYLDCFNDYLTAFGFLVTAAGVQVDLKSTSDNEDRNWDAVWESQTKIIDDGWVVEFKIPYSALRFPKKSRQLWGLQIIRNITRYRERTTWNFVNQEEDGFNNQAGELHGIHSVNPPLRLSIVPYLSGYLEKSPETKGWGYSYNYGLDLKVGLNESYTLDMTLIPDFGQVQSDNEIYNLTPFEVYFDERRPFFTEGTELFDKGDVFYSRRIGKTPSGYYDVEDSLANNEKITSNPEYAQLVNATKISGKSSNKLAVGFFNGMTANTWAEVQDTITGLSRKVKTEPYTNYNMLVLDQALKNNSFISIYNTNTYQPESKFSANVTGGETKITTKSNSYAAFGQAIVSQMYNNGLSPEFGYLYALGAGKISGNFTFDLSHQVIDDKYDPNDMGFLRHNNVVSDRLNFSYNIYQPTWKVLNWRNSLWFNYVQLYNPRTFTEFTMGIRSRTTFKNFYSAWIGGNMSPTQKYDYYEPRVENRFYIVPPSYSFNIGLSPDYKKRFLIDWRLGYYWAIGRPEYTYWFTIEPRFRVSDKLMIILESEYKYDQNNVGYVTDSTDINDMDVIIFGSRNIDTYENTLRMNFKFTNKSSINFRLRHYWITLKYNDYYELNKEGNLIYTDYSELHDFSYNIFNIDMQYIWNFAPGSEIRVVWKNAINTYDETEVINSVTQPVEDRFGPNLKRVMQSPATNSFSIKLLYYLDYQQVKKAFTKKD